MTKPDTSRKITNLFLLCAGFLTIRGQDLSFGMSEEAVIKSFVVLGLSEQKAKETLKNAAVTNVLQKLVEQVGI